MQRVSGEVESSSESSKSEAVESSDKSRQPLKKGNIYQHDTRTSMCCNMFVQLLDMVFFNMLFHVGD